MRVLYVHGFGEHKEIVSYRLLAEALNPAGVELHGFDLPGHGAERMLPPEWLPMREDLDAVVQAVQPDALLGVSLGAIVALDWTMYSASRIPLVTAGAPLGPVNIPFPILLVGKLLARVAPRTVLSPRLDVRKVSRNQELVNQYLSDPLFHQRATGPALASFFRAVEEVRAGAPRLRSRLLMLHGSDDTIAKPDPTFLARTSSTDRAEKYYSGARHNLLLETNRDEVYAELIQFFASNGNAAR
ncbi:MAG: alpha/beta hydrolase [Acidobacteria bacterium]|nr:alpha/beta hydrolase [Acidobacteriota bacterium]